MIFCSEVSISNYAQISNFTINVMCPYHYTNGYYSNDEIISYYNKSGINIGAFSK